MTWLMLAIYSDETLMKLYAGSSEENERKIWRKHFTLEPLNLTLAKLEKTLGLDEDLAVELARIRESSYSRHSKDTHTSKLAAMLGAYSNDIEDSELLKINLMGRPSSQMVRTLHALIWTLFYFNMVFHRLIKTRLNPLPKTDDFLTTMALSETFFNVWGSFRKEDHALGIP